MLWTYLHLSATIQVQQLVLMVSVGKGEGGGIHDLESMTGNISTVQQLTPANWLGNRLFTHRSEVPAWELILRC